MFTKQDAIDYIKEIQSGKFDRNDPDIPRGVLAADVWYNSLFSYGMENGAIVALMKAFDISLTDLGYEPSYQTHEPQLIMPEVYREHWRW